MENSEKIILDLASGTGAWSDPYRKAGYDVNVITLPEYDIEKAYFVTLGNDRFVVFPNSRGGRVPIPVFGIYGILAAPPCTMFSFARNDKKARAPRDFNKGLLTVDACSRVIRECFLSGQLKFWAMENPKGYLRRERGKPYLEFNPYDYGDNWSKPTDLWGFFNKPKKTPVFPAGGPDRWSDGSRFTSIDTVSPNCSNEYFKKVKGERRIIRRSITPPGFANAFCKANK